MGGCHSERFVPRAPPFFPRSVQTPVPVWPPLPQARAAALRLRRHALGGKLSADFLTRSLRPLCFQYGTSRTFSLHFPVFSRSALRSYGAIQMRFAKVRPANCELIKRGLLPALPGSRLCTRWQILKNTPP